MIATLNLQSRLKQSIIVAIGGSITFCGINLYCGSERFYQEVIPPIMSLLPPETAHRVAVKAARFGIVPKPKYIDSPLLVGIIVFLCPLLRQFFQNNIKS